jgi:hypothetical protein
MPVELPVNVDPRLLAFVAAGLVAGIILMARGFPAYLAATRIGDISTSRISSLAVGEALVSGTVEPAELTLISALQSAPCVFYRSRVETDDDGMSSGNVEERAVGFKVRDATGELRVFPRGARFDVPDCFNEKDGLLGDKPPGLDFRVGSAIAPGPADPDGQAAALLTIAGADGRSLFSRALMLPTPTLTSGSGRKTYREARIAPGDVVTIMGRALPFDQLADPGSADILDAAGAAEDPEIAADLAEARAAGILETDPEEAWGNAAIPGFGIGRPTRTPELDQDATQPAVVPETDAQAALAHRTFAIAPDALVLAAASDAPLYVSLGAPAAAESRHREQFLIGLLGAVLAIVSAMALAIMVGNGVAAA